LKTGIKQEPPYRTARMDQPPDWAPDRQVPLIACRTACSNRSTSGASAGSSSPQLHVPECSFVWPATNARHPPFHSRSILAADQVPRSKIRLALSLRVQVPDAVPDDKSMAAVQVPPKDLPERVLALQAERGPNRITFFSASAAFWPSWLRTPDSPAFSAAVCKAPKKKRNENSRSMDIDLNRGWCKRIIATSVEAKMKKRIDQLPLQITFFLIGLYFSTEDPWQPCI